MKRILETKRALEARARDESAGLGQPAGSAQPNPKAQYNFTDPESRFMISQDRFVQAITCSSRSTSCNRSWVRSLRGIRTTGNGMMPMVGTIERKSGDTRTQMLADTDYWLGSEPDREWRDAHRRVHRDAEIQT